MSLTKLGLAIALAAAVLAGESALFVNVIGRPLAGAMAGVRTLPAREPTRDDLPEAVEEIAVTAPYRMKRATTAARSVPRADREAVSVTALNGYCPHH
jgi:hypothetical protein